MADELEYREVRDSKFLHLLKPIRDIAENWSINLATELEEYLDHLDKATFAFEGGPTLDFAEAALLIQSVSCVYSKKVEYLHNLVYQALEAVRNKRRGGQDDDVAAGQDGPTQQDKAGRGEPEDDSLESFLTAGDNLKECEDIDLAEDEDQQAAAFSRPPAAMLALEDQSGGQGDGDSGFYRLSQCFVHCSGALLLDNKDGECYDQALVLRPGMHLPSSQQQPAPATWVPAAAPAPPPVPGPKPAAAGSDDDDDDGGGGNNMDEDEDEGAPGQAAKQAGEQPGIQPVLNPALQGGPPAAAGVDPQQQQQALDDSLPARDQFDPYRPLDLHIPGDLPVRPILIRVPPKNRRPAVFARKGQQVAAPVPGLYHPEFAYALELTAHSRPRKAAAAKAARAAAAQQQQQQLASVMAAAVFDWRDAQAAAEADDGGQDDGGYGAAGGADDDMDDGQAAAPHEQAQDLDYGAQQLLSVMDGERGMWCRAVLRAGWRSGACGAGLVGRGRA